MDEVVSASETVRFDITKVDRFKDELVAENILGPAGYKEMIANVFLFILYFILILLPFISYSFVSGAMQWILVLLVITLIGLVVIYFMRKGIQKREKGKVEKRMSQFTGELARLHEAVGRGADGYKYSQYMIREQLAEVIAHKVRLGRGISPGRMEKLMEDESEVKRVVGDEVLAKFILGNRRGAEGWSDKVSGKKRSKESGITFIKEIDEILKRAEVWN